MKWENVHIFISSTFNDMHAERDYLVKKVFPSLSAWCNQRKLRLFDIDLRWGVKVADSETKNTVRVCLQKIDECRPFFLCFLGQRRGWVPKAEDIGEITFDFFPKLLTKKYVGKTSVTEMEILHALVDPLHNGAFFDKGGVQHDGSAVEHAFFFLRDPVYLKDMSEDLRYAYTNKAEDDPEAADKEIEHWRKNIISKTGRPVFNYTVRWKEKERTPEIALPLYNPAVALKCSGTWKKAFDLWKKRWAAANVEVDDNGIITGSNLDRANAYNEMLTKGRLGDFSVGNQSLANVIIKQLQKAIAARFPAHMKIEAQTAQLQELEQQEQFLQMSAEGYVVREGEFDAINEYINSADCRPLAVIAEAGIGKTSFLAYFIKQHKCLPEESLHSRFIGASDRSSEHGRIWYGILQELRDIGKIKRDIVAENMLEELPTYLSEAGQTGKTIIIIDALDQLDEEIPELEWLSLILPENIKMIVSFKTDESDAYHFYKLQQEKQTMIFHHVRPADEPIHRKKIIDVYLSQYLKELDAELAELIIHSDGANNPLFIKILLSELRVFGTFDDLKDMIKSFGNNPQCAFNKMLERMENDPAYTDINSHRAVSFLFGMLAYSRCGFSEGDLVYCFKKEFPDKTDDDILDTIRLYLRQMRPYLFQMNGYVSFRYASLINAAKKRYAKELKKYDQHIWQISNKLCNNILHPFNPFNADLSYKGDVAVDLKKIQHMDILVNFGWLTRQRQFWQENNGSWARHVRECIQLDESLRDSMQRKKWRDLKHAIASRLTGDEIAQEEENIKVLLKEKVRYSYGPPGSRLPGPPPFWEENIEDRLGYVPEEWKWENYCERHVRRLLSQVKLKESLDYLKEYAYSSVGNLIK